MTDASIAALRTKISEIDARITDASAKKIELIGKLVADGTDMRHESRDLMNMLQTEIDSLRAERTSILVVFATSVCQG